MDAFVPIAERKAYYDAHNIVVCVCLNVMGHKAGLKKHGS